MFEHKPKVQHAVILNAVLIAVLVFNALAPTAVLASSPGAARQSEEVLNGSKVAVAEASLSTGSRDGGRELRQALRAQTARMTQTNWLPPQPSLPRWS